MMTISIDVIVHIIDNVDDRGTLFSLLTVNEQVFHQACRALYRDPFRFFRDDRPNDASTLQAKLSLLELLLNLSPTTDGYTNLARRVLGFSLKVEPEVENQPWTMFDYLSLARRVLGFSRKVEAETENPPRTMLDYLSLIQCVRWEGALDHLVSELGRTGKVAPSFNQYGYEVSAFYIRHALTRSIIGHRLGDIRELEIEPYAIDNYYIDVASQLSCLRSIVIVTHKSLYHELTEVIYPSVFRLVQVLQQHHGKDQLLHCRFAYGLRENWHEATFDWRVKISKLLPPIFPRDLNVALPIRPMDAYLLRMTVLKKTSYIRREWDEISKEYPDLSLGQILQRCRWLDKLVLDFSDGGINDTSLFAWAAAEARERSSEKLLAPAVSLKNLHLFMKCPGAVDARRALMDTFHGFARSLESLKLKFLPLEEEDEQHLAMLPKFKDASTAMSPSDQPQITDPASKLFDGRLLLLLPKLSYLEVDLECHRDRSVFLPSWPVLELPRLTRLRLSGQAVDLFDPASFRHMPLLQSMALSGSWTDAQCSGDGSWCPDRWAMRDWSFPELTKLRLCINSAATIFSFKAFQCCPKLQNLYLQFPTDTTEPLHQLEVLSALPDSSRDVFPQVRCLELKGQYRMQPEDLEALIGRIVPDLVILTLDSLGPCTLQQVVDYTRGCKSLRQVSLCHRPLEEEECYELGFVERPHIVYDGSSVCIYTVLQAEWMKSYNLRQRD